MEILRNIAVQAPRSLRELNPEIPAVLDQFLLRLLARDASNGGGADRASLVAGRVA